MASGAVISASTVRQCLQKEDWQSLRALVPETTLRYFQSAEAAPVLKKIREAGDVVHYCLQLRSIPAYKRRRPKFSS